MTYYVVMRLQSWDNLQIDPISALPNLPLKFMGKEIGFLPVYSSMEDARAEFPDIHIVEIQEVS